MIHPFWLGMLYGLSEAAISLVLRSKSESGGADKGSLRLIWRVIGTSMVASVVASLYVREANFGGSAVLYWSGFAIYSLGLALRWYSIAYLGRFFTVDVAVAADQKVIDTGPYRLVRHPSYAGALAAFLGLSLCIANALAMAILLIPVTAVFLYRIRIEENALQAGLGEPYRVYMSRTKRLIPYVY